MSSRKVLLTAAIAIVSAFGLSGARAANLIANGDFTTNGGVGQLAGGITSLASWTVGNVVVTANTPAGSAPFSFLMNAAADSVGFPSVFSPPNIYMWGPNTPVSAGGAKANGWTGSPTGGMFFGSDGGYATAPLSQTVSGLTIGDQYTLSFDYAAGQFSQYFGATQESWKATIGGSVYTAPTLSTPSTGFSAWRNYSVTVTATATSEVISFLATGTPVGIQPTSLLDNVQFNAAVPEPTMIGIFAIGAAGVLRRHRRVVN